MTTWEDFRFHQLVQVPRPGEDESAAAPLAASLTGSHADLLAAGRSSSLLTAWIRLPEDRRLHFLLGGRPFFPPAGDAAERPVPGESRPVLFPPGAVAVGLSIQDAAGLFDRFGCWVPCSARSDVLWAPPGAGKGAAPPRGSFDRHAAHLRGPFAWLVLAEPLPSPELKPELGSLVNEILPLTRGEVGEANRIALERKQARHRELSRAQISGAWRIRVLVGGIRARSAATAAAMLCAASELEGLPYVLAPSGPPAALADALAGPDFVSGSEVLMALTRPPDRELPGLRLVEPHGFDVTPESQEPDGIHLGSVLDETRTEVGAVVLSRDTLNRHTFVCGATGGGKSQTVRHLLAEASRTGLPWLAVEPAKAEYARMANRVGVYGQDVVVIRPGDPDHAPAGFNPLEPAPDFPLQTHLDLLRALFVAAFQPVDPFPQILAAALTRCYEELGWDLSLGEPVRDGPRPRYPTLADLQRVAAVEVTDIGYGKEANDNVQGFLKVRLNSLRRGTTGRFFEGGHPLDFKKLLHRNVVLEIQNVGDDADKAFFMGAVLIRLTEHLRGKAGDPELSHLTVVEEAHRLLRRQEAGPGAQAVEMFAALLAEVRAYGEGLIIAEQIPGKLIVDAIKNTAVKIVHRLPAADDRESVGATMNLDDAQSRYLVTLRPGDGAVFTDGMDHPLLVHVPEGTAIEGRGTPALAPVNELIGRRSVTCGPDCVARACTLREMRKGQHVLLEHPWLVVWAELTVLAHLAGHPAPLVDAAYPRLVAGQPRQVLDCAISHAVDDAIAVRSAQLHPSVHADGFAEHCCAILRAGLAGQDTRVVCDRDGLGYLSSTYQWLLARDPLLSAQREAPAHPDTPLWERHFRRPVPGRTVGEQLDVVNIWWAATLRNQTARDAVTFGTQRPSALETAIGGPATDPRWRDWLPGALMPFPGCDWPPAHLLPPQPKEPS